MKTTIVSVTVVTLKGVGSYRLGAIIEGRKIARIENQSLEYENSIYSQYSGFDEDGEIIFTVENCPVDVIYKKVE